MAQEVEIGPRKVFPRGFPTSKTVGVEGTIRPLASSHDVGVLVVHGVTEGDQVHSILHPADQSLVRSLARQEAFLVTHDFKVVDLRAYAWPINLDTATDVRATLEAPVRYGEEVGVVAGCMNDLVVFRSNRTITVPLQDLSPILSIQEAKR